jgi:hypothetical protein
MTRILAYATVAVVLIGGLILATMVMSAIAANIAHAIP